jgi:hypothetical protein
MKRFLTFGLLGPAIGGIVVFHIVTLTGTWDQPWLDELYKTFMVSIIVLPFSYVLGIIPAIVIATLHFTLRKIDATRRMLICGGAGYVAIASFCGVGEGGAKLFLVGLAGLIPALVCSWLSDRQAWTV